MLLLQPLLRGSWPPVLATPPAVLHMQHSQEHGLLRQTSVTFVLCALLQVLILDADSLPLINPEQLFHAEPFATSGNLFWPGEPAAYAANKQVFYYWNCNGLDASDAVFYGSFTQSPLPPQATSYARCPPAGAVAAVFHLLPLHARCVV
jgi:hypothetical protein